MRLIADMPEPVYQSENQKKSLKRRALRKGIFQLLYHTNQFEAQISTEELRKFIPSWCDKSGRGSGIGTLLTGLCNRSYSKLKIRYIHERCYLVTFYGTSEELAELACSDYF